MLLPSFLALWKSRPAENDYRHAVDAPLSLLVQAAKLGSVRRALIMGSSAIAYEVNGTWKKSTLPTNNPSLQSSLLDILSDGGCTNVSALPESIWSKLATPALAALPFVYLALLYRMMRNLHGKNDAARTYQNEESWQQTTFSHVAGLDNAVTEVSEVVSYLSNPTLYHGVGARPPSGVLLYGPPGTGKTLLARAVAGEAHCDTFVACSGSDFVDTYVGRGAARVRELFDRARRDARGGRWWWSRRRHSTVASAVIFIDEIDALAKNRSTFGNNDERDQTLNQLLGEMDGFAGHGDVTLIVIAATNRPDVLDPAILRRFDRQVHVGYPNAKGREEILLVHARRIQCDTNQIDWEFLASCTNDFSGADLRNVINEAALLAVRENHSLVEQRHLEEAIERVIRMKTQIGRTVTPHFATR
jgi:cell division protease FtsH